MACAQTHRLIAVAAVGSYCYSREAGQQERSIKPFAGALLAGQLTQLPDLLEPAAHPNHRQFFHSLAFAGLLGMATYKLYQWEPESPMGEAARFVALVGAAAYFIHLLVDAGSPKSLPLVGKL